MARRRRRESDREKVVPGRTDGRLKKGAVKNRFMLKHTLRCKSGGRECERDKGVEVDWGGGELYGTTATDVNKSYCYTI